MLSSVEMLAEILQSGQNASFIRLGDGEVRFITECADRLWADGKYDRTERPRSPSEATGTLGLLGKDFGRLVHAYRSATVVDTYDFIPYNKRRYEQVQRIIRGSARQMSSRSDCLLINEWTRGYLREFLLHRRVVMCGGESRLWEQLMSDPLYEEAANAYLPSRNSRRIEWVHPPEDGRNPSLNLEAIKELLLARVRDTGADAVFLSLGGVAKILAVELSEAAGVVAIDFGSMMRALTYSGSDGQAFWRATHNPFFFRVPFGVWMKAFERAHPEMDSSQITAKAQCQLALELQRKQIGAWVNADVHDQQSLDLGKDNIEHFREAYALYRTLIVDRFHGDSRVVRQLTEFDRWCAERSVPGFSLPLKVRLRRAASNSLGKHIPVGVRKRLKDVVIRFCH